MRMVNFVEYVEISDEEGILNALYNMFSGDDDLNGNNGYDYLWGVSEADGCDNNLEWLIKKSREYGMNNGRFAMIDYFFNLLRESDGYEYGLSNYTIIFKDDIGYEIRAIVYSVCFDY